MTDPRTSGAIGRWKSAPTFTRSFPPTSPAPQGAVVENKRLGAALSVIQASQLERDKVRLASRKLTLREKDRIEAARITAGTLQPAPPAADGLSEVASFLERFEAEQKARKKAHNDRTALRRKALAQG